MRELKCFVMNGCMLACRQQTCRRPRLFRLGHPLLPRPPRATPCRCIPLSVSYELNLVKSFNSLH